MLIFSNMVGKKVILGTVIGGLLGAAGIGAGIGLHDRNVQQAKQEEHARRWKEITDFQKYVGSKIGGDYDYESREATVGINENDLKYVLRITPKSTELVARLTNHTPGIYHPWINLSIDMDGNFVSATYKPKLARDDKAVSLDDPVIGEFLRMNLAEARKQLQPWIKAKATFVQDLERTLYTPIK